MGKNLLAIAVSAMALAGCNISGVAEKGPFQEGTTVTATVLNSDATLNSDFSYESSVTDASGSYSVETDIRGNVWLQLNATGSYLNELSGSIIDEPLSLNATARANTAFSRVNINLFSHFVTARFQQRVADGQSLRRAYNLSEADLRNTFDISRRSTVLSISDGRSRRRSDNANLALFSGAFASLEAPAVALENLTLDFADDGLFNGVGEAAFASIALKSAEAGLLTTIRENLIANGAINPPDETDLGELPSWVDTEGSVPVEVNTAPVAQASVEVVDEDSSIEITLNASDADGDALTFTTTTASNGSVSLLGNIATYTPNANFNGSDSFSFTVSDGELSASADVSIDVAAVDDLPTAEDIEAGVVTAGEVTNVLLLGADIDSDISYTTTDGSLGTVSLATESELGVYATYTAGLEAGLDSFTYTVTGDEQSATATVLVTVEPIPEPEGVIQGTVRDIQGNLLTDVSIEFLGYEGLASTTTSDASGAFDVSSEINSFGVLRLNKAGYATQVAPVSFLEGVTPVNIVMVERAETQTVNVSEFVTARGADGASVGLGPFTFVDADGQAVYGDIEVTMTPLDVSNTAALAAFPGDFFGVYEESEFASSIATLGTTEFIFSQNGQPITVAPNNRVEINLPIYNTTNPSTGRPVVVGDIIDLWSLDEDKGFWVNEGSGVVVESPDSPTGFALSTSVSHFTWWNVDVAVNPAGVNVTVNAPTDSNGAELDSDIAVVHVIAESGFGWRASRADTSVEVGGQPRTLGIPANTRLCFWVEYALTAGGTLNSDEQCLDTENFGFYELTFDATASADALALEVQSSDASYQPLQVIEPIRIAPSTVETLIEYSVVGDLPAGLSLVLVSPVTAEIHGTVTAPEGSYVISIQGIDSDGNVSTVDHNFTVDGLQSPVLEGSGADVTGNQTATVSRSFVSYYEVGNVQIDLNNYNVGGPATLWTYELPDTDAYPYDVTVSESGILSVSHLSEPFEGQLVSDFITVQASNPEGDSNELTINVQMEYLACFGGIDVEFEFEGCIPILQ
ncbi:hypothetical protein EOL70_11640 [Leucothrix sargassi]|nr:hypothetical protein EOL70_11640 [Leucothrix sargassi]